MSRKRKTRQRRRAVDRHQRVKPTPETLAKLRPHPLELLLAKGRDDGGIDADQWQCAEEVYDAYAAVTRGLGLSSVDVELIARTPHNDAMSMRDEHLSLIWFTWASELMHWCLIKPTVVVELINGQRLLNRFAVGTLCRALDLWAKVRGDLARPEREVATIRNGGLDTEPVTLLTSRRASCVQS